jgi:hypothetical protein
MGLCLTERVCVYATLYIRGASSQAGVFVRFDALQCFFPLLMIYLVQAFSFRPTLIIFRVFIFSFVDKEKRDRRKVCVN